MGVTEQDLRAYFGGSSFRPSLDVMDESGSCIVFLCFPNSPGDESQSVMAFLIRDGKVAANGFLPFRADFPPRAPTAGADGRTSSQLIRRVAQTGR
jgi:hypothetical protein